MTHLIRLGIAGALSAVVPAQSASAVTLCAKRSGRIVAAERCGRRDTALTPAEIGIATSYTALGLTPPFTVVAK